MRIHYDTIQPYIMLIEAGFREIWWREGEKRLGSRKVTGLLTTVASELVAAGAPLAMVLRRLPPQDFGDEAHRLLLWKDLMEGKPSGYYRGVFVYGVPHYPLNSSGLRVGFTINHGVEQLRFPRHLKDGKDHGSDALEEIDRMPLRTKVRFAVQNAEHSFSHLHMQDWDEMIEQGKRYKVLSRTGS